MTFTATIQQNGHRLTTSLDRDQFDSASFEGGRESLPYLQMLNHQNPDESGFFITSENMEAVGFTPN